MKRGTPRRVINNNLGTRNISANERYRAEWGQGHEETLQLSYRLQNVSLVQGKSLKGYRLSLSNWHLIGFFQAQEAADSWFQEFCHSSI